MSSNIPAQRPWHDLFVGRSNELQSLQAAWQTAKTNNPTVVALIADSGFGKTRLVHEFYRWLSAEENQGAGYWPGALPASGSKLDVNPPLQSCGLSSSKMPFLWWGLQLLNRGDSAASGSVLSLAVDVLKSHLGALEKATRDEARRKSLRAEGLDASGDLSMEFFGEGLSMVVDGFGFGLLKTVYQKAKTYREIKREQQIDDMLNTAPVLEGQRQRSDLVKTVVNDLRRVTHQPPAGIEPKPVVLFIDDAQWTDHDSSIGPLIDDLLKTAKAEGWPLFVILNCWEYKWRASDERSLQELCSSHVGDTLKEITLGKVADLGPVVDRALPGLTATQRAAILAKVEGNPKYLDTLLQSFIDAPRWFIDRRLDQPLTADGEAELSKTTFAKLMSDRLKQAGTLVRQSLALASNVGPRFSNFLVARAGTHLGIENIDAGLEKAAAPLSLISIKGLFGEFRQNVFFHAALEDTPNLFDENQVSQALEVAARELGESLKQEESDEETLRELYDLLSTSESAPDRAQAYSALGKLVRIQSDAHDARSAVELARVWLAGYNERQFPIDHTQCAEVDAVANSLEEWGQREEALKLRLIVLMEVRNRYEQDSNYDNALDLYTELHNVAGAVKVLEGPEAADPYLQECRSIAAGMCDEDSSAEILQRYGFALFWLGYNEYQQGNFVRARDLFDESVSIQKTVTNVTQADSDYLAFAMTAAALGNAIANSDDLTSALPHFETSIAVLRTFPDKQLELSAALGSLGVLHNEADSSLEAARYFDEALSELGTIPIHELTPQARLACTALTYFAGMNAAKTGSDKDAAPKYFKALESARDTLAHVPSPQSRRFLALTLQLCAGACQAKGELRQARDYAVEAVTHYRELQSALGTVESMKDLSRSLLMIGELSKEHSGPESARPYFEGHLELLKAIREQDHVDPVKMRQAYHLLGEALVAAKSPIEAEATFLECLAFSREQTKIDASAANLREEFVLLGKLARLARRRWKFAQWWRYKREAFELSQRIVKLLEEQGMQITQIRKALLTGENM